jgi:uncharacterized protein (UPF0276 family)
MQQAHGLPADAGVCLKPVHYRDALSSPSQPAFLEIHAENYLHAGGPAHRYLEAIRREHRLSIHGTGLSLGGPEAPSTSSLAARAALLARYQPDEFSEHLAWTQLGGHHFNDLLPLAYTPESLARVAEHVDITQNALRRRILIENPATYLRFTGSSIGEAAFLAELVARTGCGLLLDVNNIIVSAGNHGFDPAGYLDALPLHAVGEVHLAGHAVRTDPEGNLLLIDSHDCPVQPLTWSLYRMLLDRNGPLPTLIEWDGAVPDWDTLLQEALTARTCLHNCIGDNHAAA